MRQSFFNLRRQQSAATHQLGEEECATFCQRIEQSSARDREVHGRIRSGQDQPILQVLSLVKRDRAGSQRSAGTRARILWRAQPSPTDATRKTKAIKPLGIVLGNTRGEDRRFPSRQRQLAAVELFQHGLQTLRSFDAMIGVDPLPREQKPIKILNRDRLNFRAQPIDRQPMNSCQQSAVAPFLFRCVRMKFAAQNKTFAFESKQTSVDF